MELFVSSCSFFGAICVAMSLMSAVVGARIVPFHLAGATSKSVVYCVLCRALIDDGRPPNKAYCVQLAATLSVLFYPLMDKGFT